MTDCRRSPGRNQRAANATKRAATRCLPGLPTPSIEDGNVEICGRVCTGSESGRSPALPKVPKPTHSGPSAAAGKQSRAQGGNPTLRGFRVELGQFASLACVSWTAGKSLGACEASWPPVTYAILQQTRKKTSTIIKTRQKGGCPSSQYSTPPSLCRSPSVAVLLVLQRKLFVRLPFLPGEIVAARGAALVCAGRPGIVDLAASV